MNDLAEVERIAGALLRSLAPAERRGLLRTMARDLRQSQSARIAAQRDPSGAAFAPRRPKREPRLGTHAVKFLYPKGAAEPRLVFMKSWAREGPLITGYDIEAGGIRSFFWDQIDKWVPVEAPDRNKGGGKYRRKGSIKRAAMFRRLRTARNLRAGSTDAEAWVGFMGRAAEIARVSQDGLMDRPAAGARAVRYAQRGLLGLAQPECDRMLDIVMDHVAAVA